MATYAYIHEVARVEVDGDTFYVKRFSIACTPFVVYETWEQTDMQERQHTSFCHEEGMTLGKITSRANPEQVEALTPGSPERIEACATLRHARELLAERAIVEAFPSIVDRSDVRWRDGTATTSELED